LQFGSRNKRKATFRSTVYGIRLTRSNALSNSDSSAVSISNVTVSGPFVLSSNCGSSVAASGSCPIYVYFYPSSARSVNGTLTVIESASNSPQTASLQEPAEAVAVVRPRPALQRDWLLLARPIPAQT
jgi:hypothetical protein